MDLKVLHPIYHFQYFIRGYDSIFFYKTVLFAHFSHKVLKILPRLVKDFDAILYGKILTSCYQVITIIVLLLFKFSSSI